MTAYSSKDSRAQKPNAATTRTINGTVTNDVQTSSNPAVPPTDSRPAGAPTDSRVAANIPENSRSSGTNGPGN
jgi:hypothetical protein